MGVLRIRRLRIRVATEVGSFGTDIAFPNGLVVLRADNTSGKSTCLMSLLYGLGLEGMLGPIQHPPLPPAMLEEISTDKGLQRVIDSFVSLEIEGAGGRVATVRRQATGPLLSRQRISVIDGAALSDRDGQHPLSRDYFVRTKGAAQRELGFHSFLASFMGLTLPVVSKFDGESTPLYLECLFPFFFVDQLSGWRDVKARMPTYLQIPEMSKRAAEFILALDILLLALQRERLTEDVELVKRRWANVAADTKARMPRIGLVVQDVPDTPPDSWPSDHLPRVLVSRDDTWVPLEQHRRDLSARLSQLVSDEIPRAKEVSDGATDTLREFTEQLDEAERRLDAVVQDVATSEAADGCRCEF